MAELVEYNLEDVDAAILAARVALANGMDWEDLARMIKEEKKSGNPVTGLIDKLHLERNSITLLLSNNLDEMDEDEKTSPADKVEKLARECFFFLTASFAFDETTFGEFSGQKTTNKLMQVSRPISYVFYLHPPTDIQFGDYSSPLYKGIHKDQ